MSLVVVNGGEEAVLDAYFAVAALGGGHALRLFTNDVTAGLTPAEIDALVTADFTEATFAGYAAVVLAGGSWTTTQGDPTRATYAQQSFTRSSTGTAQLIRGYYLTLEADDSLQWFEEFTGPVSIEFINDELQITPILTLGDRSDNVSVPIGGSILWSGPIADIPSGYLVRDGSAVSRTTYAELFALIGTTYGPGDGSTTFNLPDSRGRFPLGVAASGTGSALGDTGGAIDHTHGLDTASSHARITLLTSAPHARQQRKTVTSWTETLDINATSGATGSTATTLGTALGGDSDTENPPYLAEYFIIRAL